MKLQKNKIVKSNIAGHDIIINDNKQVIRLLTEILKELRQLNKKGKK